jgi:hypothetical protein
MKKLIKTCIAVAAFAAFLVVPSIASAAPTLTAPTGTHLAGSTEAGTGNGAKIQGTNVAHDATAQHTLMTIPGVGNVTCNTATLTGEVAKNKEGEVWGNITTAEFRGRVGDLHGPDCSSPLGNTTVTPSHTVNPTHNNIHSLPWCVTAKGNEDTFTVRGGGCHEAARPLTFVLHVGGLACSYEKASVTGKYTTHPNAALLTINKQNFTEFTSNIFCPNEGALDMAFTLETDTGNPQDAYIDNV